MSSFNIKFLGSYVDEGYTVYVINPDSISRQNFMRKTSRESDGKIASPLFRLSDQGLSDLGLSFNSRGPEMHYLKIKTGQESLFHSELKKILGHSFSGARPSSNWDGFMTALESVKKFDFEEIEKLWVDKDAAEKLKPTAPRKRIKTAGVDEPVQNLGPRKVRRGSRYADRASIPQDNKRPQQAAPSSAPASAPGFVLGTPADGRGFDFLLEGGVVGGSAAATVAEFTAGAFGLDFQGEVVGGSPSSAAANATVFRELLLGTGDGFPAGVSPVENVGGGSGAGGGSSAGSPADAAADLSAFDNLVDFDGSAGFDRCPSPV